MKTRLLLAITLLLLASFVISYFHVPVKSVKAGPKMPSVSAMRPGFLDNLCKEQGSTVRTVTFYKNNKKTYEVECANGVRVFVPF